MDHDGLLSEFYASDSGFGPAYYYMQDAIRPIMHRYQKMDILEIGMLSEPFYPLITSADGASPF